MNTTIQMEKEHYTNIKTDLKWLISISSSIVIGLVGVMLFSPLSSQFTDKDLCRGDTWCMEIDDMMNAKLYDKALDMTDSLITIKEMDLPKIAYFDRYLTEDKRIDAANARADIYDLQWKRIEILQATNNREMLKTELEEYCSIIGYNQKKAILILNQLKEK